MAHLAIFQPDARVEARLCDALAVAHSVTTVASWERLREVVATSTDGCIVDADFPTRKDAIDQIGHLRELSPGLAVVVYADVHASDIEVFHFGEIGVDGVVLAGRPPWASSLRDTVDRALASATAARLRDELSDRYADDTVRAIAWAVEHAREVPSVSTFAAALGRNPRTLGLALHGSGLPSPTRLLLWGRLLLAGEYLARDHRTVEDTALLLGYSTAHALGRAMKRETGCTPREVIDRGGITFLQQCLFEPDRRLDQQEENHE